LPHSRLGKGDASRDSPGEARAGGVV